MASGPLTIMEAAQHLNRSQSATSEQIERLIKRKLLVRIPDERDRRRHLVWLTPNGRSMLEEERHVLSLPLIENALLHMTAEQQTQLIEGLTTFAEAALKARNCEINTLP